MDDTSTERQEKRSSKDDASIAFLMNELLLRAKRLRRLSTFLIITMCALIIGGFWAFLVAGQIALAEEKERRTSRTAELDSVRSVLVDLDRMRQSSYSDAIGSTGGSKDRTNDILHEEAATEFSHARRVLDEARQAVQSFDTSHTVLVSSVSARLGALVLLITILQLGMSIYRYNARLISYYQSCADILRLPAADLAVSRTDLIRLLSNVPTEFGKVTDAISKDVLKKLTDALNSFRE